MLQYRKYFPMSKSIFMPISKKKEDRANFQGTEHTRSSWLYTLLTLLDIYLSCPYLHVQWHYH